MVTKPKVTKILMIMMKNVSKGFLFIYAKMLRQAEHYISYSIILYKIGLLGEASFSKGAI